LDVRDKFDQTGKIMGWLTGYTCQWSKIRGKTKSNSCNSENYIRKA